MLQLGTVKKISKIVGIKSQTVKKNMFLLKQSIHVSEGVQLWQVYYFVISPFTISKQKEK